MSAFLRSFLAPPASTGNNTHTSVGASAVPANAAVLFIVEAVGGTPTVTWKVQGSIEDGSVSDANSAWFDLPYVTETTDTLSQATRTATAVGEQVEWIALANIRFFKKFRVVTTANTNVTYRAELHQQYRN